MMVYSKYKQRCVVLGWSGHQDLLGANVEVLYGSLLLQVSTSALCDVFSSGISPSELSGIFSLENFDLVSVALNTSVNLLHFVIESSYSI